LVVGKKLAVFRIEKALSTSKFAWDAKAVTAIANRETS
jgi:hypothetical protein